MSVRSRPSANVGTWNGSESVLRTPSAATPRGMLLALVTYRASEPEYARVEAEMQRVVLVDSDELSRRVAARQLRHHGSDVVEADEQQAMALFRDGVEALVIWNARDADGVA